MLSQRYVLNLMVLDETTFNFQCSYLQAVTGKAIQFGYDVKGRPSFYLRPSRQNTIESVRQIRFAVWMLERGIRLMEPGVE